MERHILVLLIGSVGSTAAMALPCSQLPAADELKSVLVQVVNDPKGNGGVKAPEWLTLVDNTGTVCAVVHSETNVTPDTTTTVLAPVHRMFSAQKAGTANGFSRAGIGVSTAQLFFGSQLDEIASGMDAGTNGTFSPYSGNPADWGTKNDPYIGKRVGTGSALPGGLALFNKDRTKVGAIGVSGDFRCTDHVIAWKVRESLKDGAYTAANVPFGLSAARNDAMMQDVDPATGKSASGYGYYRCDSFNANPTNDNDGGAIEGN